MYEEFHKKKLVKCSVVFVVFVFGVVFGLLLFVSL